VITFLLSLCALQTGCYSSRLTHFRHMNRNVFPLLPICLFVNSGRLKRYGGSGPESNQAFAPRRTESAKNA